MKELKFKTNINCTGCLAKVSPGLNETAGEGNWKVDLNDPGKILTVGNNVSEAKLLNVLKKIGFKAERI